jgi:hypothetical protein
MDGEADGCAAGGKARRAPAPHHINAGEKQTIDGMAGVFSGRVERAPAWTGGLELQQFAKPRQAARRAGENPRNPARPAFLPPRVA